MSEAGGSRRGVSFCCFTALNCCLGPGGSFLFMGKLASSSLYSPFPSWGPSWPPSGPRGFGLATPPLLPAPAPRLPTPGGGSPGPL